jgi:hypothetical protein
MNCLWKKNRSNEIPSEPQVRCTQIPPHLIIRALDNRIKALNRK